MFCCKKLQRSRPGQCFPALKVEYCFGFCCLTWMFLLHLKSMASLVATENRLFCSMVLQVCDSMTGNVQLSWRSSGTCSDLRECRAQLSPLPVTVKKSLGDNTGLWAALLLPLLQEQNPPADLAGSWSFSLRSSHVYHTKAVSVQTKIFQNPLWL